jgi:pyrroline-5-carboxylate reductase
MKVSFIGGGNMGEAIVSALINNHTCIPSDICVSEPLDTRRDYLKQKYGVRVTAANREAVGGAEVVVMSIKPQALPGVMPELAGALQPGQLVLSIMAGATISTLRVGLQHQRIIRSMPNTPAQIGMGMTVWTATPEVTEEQKKAARTILAVMGKEIYVEEERTVDKATAVHGSGPAYFFLFVEALIDAAVNIGLPREIARTLVLQTMLGAGNLIEKSGKEPGELRQMVTSKGGTTAAALQVFQEGEFNILVARAVEAAYKRSRELGGEKVN